MNNIKIKSSEVLSYDQAYHGSDDFRVQATSYVEGENFQGWFDFEFAWDVSDQKASDLFISYVDLEDDLDEEVIDEIREEMCDYIAKGKLNELEDISQDDDE